MGKASIYRSEEEKDVFFPGSSLENAANEIIPNVQFEKYDMAHFPSENHLKMINVEILEFFQKNY